MEFFSCDGLFQSFSRLDPKPNISEESYNSWIPWYCTMVLTALIAPGHYMPLPRSPTYVQLSQGITWYFPWALHFMHQYVSHVVPRHHMSTIQSKASSAITQEVHVWLHQGITCHCPKGQAADGDISCPMAIKANILTLGTTCHCPMA